MLYKIDVERERGTNLNLNGHFMKTKLNKT